MKSKRGYIVPHTHWDREWRYPIWENRRYLVDMLDELLDVLAKNPDYKSFLFDGQVVGIEDYLQVRSHREAELRRYISEGRIAVGPWYTLPDLYPLSGESIVRNLLEGRRRAGALGRCMNIGYESFGWGQPSQLPQIYAGFGIDTVIISKNVDKKRAPTCEFKWTGADGTSVYATRLGDDARANFFMNAYLHIMNGMDYHSDDYRFHMGEDGQVYHCAGREDYTEDYFKLEHREKIHPECVRRAAEKAWEAMRATLLPDDRVLMDGTDSTTAQPQLMELIQELNRQFEDIDFQSASLEEYVAVLKEKLSLDELPEISGELRDGPTTSLSGNALMTRPHLKALNKKLQNTLFGGAEPFSCVGLLLGEEYDSAFLDIAVHYMLLSHAHDSINGVTQDKTVEDVLYRLNQGLEIARTVYNRACQNILRHIDFSAYGKDDILLVAFNPHPKASREMMTAYIDTPQSRNIWDFAILDSDGNECSVQQVSRAEVTSPVAHLHARPFPYYADRHCVVFDGGEIPAGGYRVYSLRVIDHFNRRTEFWAKTRKTDGREIASSPTHMENAYLSVDIAPNGSLQILDKASGERYENLNLFESTGDVGDYWMYYPPYDNQTYTSKGCQAEICLRENGNLQATIGVTVRMRLPAYGCRPENYIRGESRRSEEKKELVIRTEYTLQKDAKKVLVRTVIDNNCKDHRMSVTFGTGVHAETVEAQGHFTIDRRAPLPLKDEQGRYYNELTTQPFQNFVALRDRARSFGVITDCMGEYEARLDGERTLALTLFRAVKNIICTEWRSAGVFPGQEGGQLQQKLTYTYAICPCRDTDLLTEAERFNLPLKLVQTCVPVAGQGTLPLKQGFYALKGNLGFSAMKKAENSGRILVRLYNPNEREEKAEFFLKGMKRACMVNLAEERELELAVQAETVGLTVGANRIVTLEIEE